MPTFSIAWTEWIEWTPASVAINHYSVIKTTGRRHGSKKMPSGWRRRGGVRSSQR